jgi:hypothetical protein
MMRVVIVARVDAKSNKALVVGLSGHKKHIICNTRLMTRSETKDEISNIKLL